MYLIVAEKPSVARAIRRALGRSVKVFSLRGHVVDVDLPEGFDWDEVDPLEIFDVEEFRVVIRDLNTYEGLVKFFRENDGVLVLATDNDHEGELIAYEVLGIWWKVKGHDTLYKRMRFNSTDKRELIKAFRNLESDLNWRWVYKAMLRRNFDLITGAAFTRHLTFLSRKLRVKFNRVVSFGSCQSPALYFIVKRETEIKSFRPRVLWVLEAEIEYGRETLKVTSNRMEDEGKARQLLELAKLTKTAVVTIYEEKEEVIRRPLPIYTDDLLVDLVRLTGQSAAKILSIAEDLYAEGYISYPRTETNKYPVNFDFKTSLKAVLNSPIGKDVAPHLSTEFNPRNGRKNDGAHPPIHPVNPFNGSGLKWTVWEYVARRFVANAFLSNARAVRQTLEVSLSGVKMVASGFAIIDEGFYKVFPYFRPSDRRLPTLRPGQALKVIEVRLKRVKTKPPSRYTEADLLREMEKHGIGTDATRATYPRILLDRGYAVKTGKTLRPTELGVNLIRALEGVAPQLVTPETRRFVETLMSKIERGEETYDRAFRISREVYRRLFIKLTEREDEVSEKLLGRS